MYVMKLKNHSTSFPPSCNCWIWPYKLHCLWVWSLCQHHSIEAGADNSCSWCRVQYCRWHCNWWECSL